MPCCHAIYYKEIIRNLELFFRYHFSFDTILRIQSIAAPTIVRMNLRIFNFFLENSINCMFEKTTKEVFSLLPDFMKV